MGWATGASAGAPPPAAWTIAGIVDWLSVPFHWSFVFIGVASGLGTLFALHRFIHPEPKQAPNKDILAEIQKLRLELLAKNPSQAQQIETFATTATDLAGSNSAEDRSIAREAVEGDPLAASDRLMAEVETGVAEQAERARQAARIAAPFSVAKAITAYARAVDLDPNDFWTWIELARLHRAAGSLPQARRTAEAAFQHVGSDWDRMVAEGELGNVAVAEGKLPAAIQHFTSTMQASRAIAEAAPEDLNRQRQLSVAHEKLGDVARAQGDLAGARAAYAAGLAIRERLAAADPGNAEWQRDVSIAHAKFAQFNEASGDIAGAIREFEAILVALLARVGEHPGFVRDLAQVRADIVRLRGA